MKPSVLPSCSWNQLPSHPLEPLPTLRSTTQRLSQMSPRTWLRWCMSLLFHSLGRTCCNSHIWSSYLCPVQSSSCIQGSQQNMSVSSHRRGLSTHILIAWNTDLNHSIHLRTSHPWIVSPSFPWSFYDYLYYLLPLLQQPLLRVTAVLGLHLQHTTSTSLQSSSDLAPRI